MDTLLDIVRDVFSRGSDQMLGRVKGPLNFRLLATPTMVIILAIITGIKDARAGITPFLQKLFTEPAEWRATLKSGWVSLKKVIILAFVLDILYQFYVFRAYFVFQTVILVAVLAVTPYCIVRGITTRIAGIFLKK